MIAGLDIVNAARQWLETPFHHQGRSVHGIDCIGLVVRVYTALGYPMRDDTRYPRIPDGRLERALDAQMQRTQAMQPGDVLLFRVGYEIPNHVGIYTGETVIHALIKNKRVKEHRFDDRWKRRLAGIYTQRVC